MDFSMKGLFGAGYVSTAAVEKFVRQDKNVKFIHFMFESMVMHDNEAKRWEDRTLVVPIWAKVVDVITHEIVDGVLGPTAIECNQDAARLLVISDVIEAPFLFITFEYTEDGPDMNISPISHQNVDLFVNLGQYYKIKPRFN